MADARLEIKAGSVSITGEGTEKWLAEQLDKILEKLPELRQMAAHDSDGSGEGADDSGKTQRVKGMTKVNLAAYLKDKKADSQARRFLATAAWLQESGQESMKTGDIVKALHEHKQGKLTNPSQCLSNNVTSGSIVKQGQSFYVTEDGLAGLNK